MKLRYVFTVLSLAVLGAACNKQLDTGPQASLTQIKTFSDVRNALLGCYAGFQSSNYYNSPAASGSSSGWSTIPDLMGDDFVEALESLGNWRALSEMTYAADNGQVQGLFSQPYEVISRANNLLQALPAFSSGDNAAEAMQIKAQALAIRAMAHFDLMRYFAQDFGRNSGQLGVPYVTYFNAADPFKNLPSRNSVKEDYDSLYSDLENSLQAFRDAGDLSADNTSRTLIDSLVVHAIRARVSYYAAQWQAAADDAAIALDLRPLGSADDYVASFSTQTEGDPPSEVYWAIPSDNTLTPGGATNGPNPNYRVSSATSAVIQGLGGAYTSSAIIKFNQTGIGGYPRTLCWKYPGINSFKVFRAGEMILIKAEAEAQLGLDGDALADLNELRSHRGVAAGSESGAALLTAITTLRRVELLGEGHRWFDLKRTSRVIDRSDCGPAGGSPSTTCTIGADARGWILPIPVNDVTANPKLAQNPGY
ncbi:MAG TPA: RagB/SusD family nutrient uptake outer membrane protein [Chitinophagaceae bacterium]|nr:RagB/SusD family nutrient uptake outer membrane protein [Chitinophagaceae bacterium]